MLKPSRSQKVLLAVSLALVFGNASGWSASTTDAQKTIDIDLRNAVAISLPQPSTPLTPKEFQTKDLKKGWLIEIPGNRPIATPAYWEGMLFVGGGYGSHEFYAFDAKTGRLVWKITTKDDGPTAAVVEDGLVAFNTESCTVMVVEAKTGKLVWEQWLGDPLMSQPAAAGGKLFIAYPSSNGVRSAKEGPMPAGYSHRMLCADLKTGKHIWSVPITADVQTAPIVDGDKVYCTCFDGTTFCIDIKSGKVLRKDSSNATSAPLISHGQIITTARQDSKGAVQEGIRSMDLQGSYLATAALRPPPPPLVALGPADYLRSGGGGVAVEADKLASMDSSVGFSTAPSSAGLNKAKKLLGVDSVSGAFYYQGIRPAGNDVRIVNAQGSFVNSVARSSGKLEWRAKATNAGSAPGSQLFLPAALGKKNMYLCSQEGHFLALNQETGKPIFMYSTGQQIAFQPALVNGNAYFGTNSGCLVCLNTGDPDADGWTAWGGNAQHNK
jgi:Ca-activated chloride channel homolog